MSYSNIQYKLDHFVLPITGLKIIMDMKYVDFMQELLTLNRFHEKKE